MVVSAPSNQNEVRFLGLSSHGPHLLSASHLLIPVTRPLNQAFHRPRLEGPGGPHQMD